MKKLLILIIFPVCLLFCSCSSNGLKGNLKHDFKTSGALGDDCFQVIIPAMPDYELKTMAEQRESAFIKAKNSIVSETERQILAYYSTVKSIDTNTLPQEKSILLKKKSASYSKKGIIEQEYYLIDNSAVLVYRILDNDIINEIINN